MLTKGDEFAQYAERDIAQTHKPGFPRWANTAARFVAAWLTVWTAGHTLNEDGDEVKPGHLETIDLGDSTTGDAPDP